MHVNIEVMEIGSYALSNPRLVLALTLTLGWTGAPGCGGDPGSQEDSFTTGVNGGGATDAADTDTMEPSCGANTDCDPGHICQAGACVANLPGGPCDDDSNCVDNEACISGECVPDDGSDTADDMGCGGEAYQATAIMPNVLIVLDRSGSMDAEIDNQGTKWEIARSAIYQVLADYGDQVWFGLMAYPGTDQKCDDGMSCGPGAVFVDVGAGTTTAITNFLDDADTCGFGTPTAETLEILMDYPGLEDHERPNFILLITDGQSSCDDPVPMVQDLYGKSPEIKTFVVGFGDGVEADELNDMAEAGGTALEGDTMYYQADNAQALVDAFGEIAGSVLSCSFLLDMVPPDPDELYVYMNDTEIPRDLTHASGWDYDSVTNQISFYGPSCELLQSGQVMDLQIEFGCPEPP